MQKDILIYSPTVQTERINKHLPWGVLYILFKQKSNQLGVSFRSEVILLLKRWPILHKTGLDIPIGVHPASVRKVWESFYVDAIAARSADCSISLSKLAKAIFAVMAERSARRVRSRIKLENRSVMHARKSPRSRLLALTVSGKLLPLRGVALFYTTRHVKSSRLAPEERFAIFNDARASSESGAVFSHENGKCWKCGSLSCEY